ncbi:MAG: hypothetical protein NC819_01890 [Candidatus Omnitrophica bacterium]|nr:hypothetical protein [Candidatus Omnitrophota bacterium]
MRDAGTYDLDGLVNRAARSMESVVLRFKKRCWAMQARPADAAESARLAQMLKNRAKRARMSIRAYHGRVAHLVGIMQSHEVITRGEAQPVEERLTQLLAQSLNRVEELLRRHERTMADRRAITSEKTSRNLLHGAKVGYRLIRRWGNNGRNGWDDI